MKRPVTFLLVASMLISASALADGMSRGSQKKIAQVAAEAGATVILSNHSEYDGAYTKARLVSLKREAGESHPFLAGEDTVQRYFTVMMECATASKLRNATGARP